VQPIGIIANPASGKDIRRLVAHASVFDNQEKRNILRRAVLGATAAGAHRFLYMPDSHGLAASAFEGIEGNVQAEPLAVPTTADARDTVRAAAALRTAGCAVVISLGGDGTNRALALGWRDAPLVAISTGTNNVFPRMLEGTVAGAAAGLIAAGAVALEHCSSQVKTVAIEVDGEADDLALVDAALVAQQHTGARALWHPEALRAAVLTRAEPAATGIAAIGGLLCPTTDEDDCGLGLWFGPSGTCLRAPLAPGLYRLVGVRDHHRLFLGDVIEWEGPGVLALDGERERVLRPGQRVRLTVRRDGPRVVDVARALHAAVASRAFVVGRRDLPGR
jgi:predicted polyphosphate/ATP-dependent NAD kinase